MAHLHIQTLLLLLLHRSTSLSYLLCLKMDMEFNYRHFLCQVVSFFHFPSQISGIETGKQGKCLVDFVVIYPYCRLIWKTGDNVVTRLEEQDQGLIFLFKYQLDK